VTFRYDPKYQLLYFAGGMVVLLFGLFLVYLGYESLTSVSVPSGMGRRASRAVGRGIVFIILMMIGGLYCAFYSRKPFKLLADSLSSKVILTNEGITFFGFGSKEEIQWDEVRKLSEDDFLGLEIKLGARTVLIPKRYDPWDKLVEQAKALGPQEAQKPTSPGRPKRRAGY
jgi:hypothetical protein